MVKYLIPKDEKEREKVRKQLRKVGDEFLKTVKEAVDNAVFLCDIDSLDGLVQAIDVYTAYMLVKTIRNKGFSKDLTKLCDKVGRASTVNH